MLGPAGARAVGRGATWSLPAQWEPYRRRRIGFPPAPPVCGQPPQAGPRSSARLERVLDADLHRQRKRSAGFPQACPAARRDVGAAPHEKPTGNPGRTRLAKVAGRDARECSGWLRGPGPARSSAGPGPGSLRPANKSRRGLVVLDDGHTGAPGTVFGAASVPGIRGNAYSLSLNGRRLHRSEYGDRAARAFPHRTLDPADEAERHCAAGFDLVRARGRGGL